MLFRYLGVEVTKLQKKRIAKSGSDLLALQHNFMKKGCGEWLQDAELMEEMRDKAAQEEFDKAEQERREQLLR